MSTPTVPDFELLFHALPAPHLAFSPDDFAVVAANASAGRLLAAAPGQPAAGVLAAATGRTPEAWVADLERVRMQGREHTFGPEHLGTLATQSGAGCPYCLTIWPVTAAGETAPRYLLCRFDAALQPLPAAPGPLDFTEIDLPQMVWSADADGSNGRISTRWHEYSGQPSTASRTLEAWMSHLHPDDQLRVRDAWLAALAGGTTFESDYRLRGRDGTYRWFLVQGQLLPQAKGPKRWLGTFTDIHEQKVRQQRQRRQERRLLRQFDQLPLHLVVMHGPEHIVRYFSAKSRAFLTEDSLGKPAREAQPRPAARLLAVFDAVYRTEQVRRMEAVTVAPLDAPDDARQLDITVQPLYDRRGRVEGVLLAGLDVTEQLRQQQVIAQATAETQRQQEQFHFLSELIPQLLWTTDAAGRHDYFNQRWYAYTGAAPASTGTSSWTAVLHPADQLGAEQRWRASLERGMPFETECRLRTHKGSHRWFLVQALPLRDAAGHISKWFGACTDIDDAKRVQQRLLEKDRQLQQILAHVPAYVAAVRGPQHICAFATPNYLSLMGGRMRVGWPLAETMPELRNGDIIAMLDEVYRTGRTFARQDSPGLVLNAQTGEPEERYFDFTHQPMHDEQGQIQGVLIFAIDVTERVLNQRQSETLAAAVRQRDAQIRTMTEALPLISYIKTPGGKVRYISPQWAAYTGQEPAAAQGQQWQDFIHPDDLVAGAATFAEAHRARQLWTGQLRLRRHDGQYRWHVSRAVPVLNEQDRITQWYGSVVDVHEQVELQEQLQRSEQGFRFLADAVPLFIWTATPTGELDYLNRRYRAYIGLPAEEPSQPDWARIIHPDDRAATEQQWTASVGTGQDYQIEHRLLGADGQYRWHLVRATAMRDTPDGPVVRWYGSSTDIDEQRALNDRLRRSEERFRFLTHSIPHIIWTTDAQGQVDYLSPQWFRLTGQDPLDPTLMGPDAGWLQAVHPLDLAAVEARLRQALADRLPYSSQLRLRSRDGQYRWHLVRGVPNTGPDGTVTRLYGSSTDIHEQHELQEQLRRSEEQFRFLANSIPQLVWTLEPNGTAAFVNKGWVEYTGMDLEQIRREGWLQLIPASERALTADTLSENMRLGRNHEHESRMRRAADGQWRWFLHRAQPMRDAEGQILMWFGTSTDIDDYKRFQQELQARNAELLRINQDLDNFVYTASHDLKQPIDNMAGIFTELTHMARFQDSESGVLVGMFEHSLEQIYDTIHDLAALVQVQKQNQQLPAEPVELATLTQEVLRSIGEQLRAAKAEVELNFEALPVVLFVRPNLQSVLYNLISNAVKYAAPERRPLIRVTSVLEEGEAVLTVQDNGLGIDLERYGHELFQMFRRFHDHVEGSGMGLYLVQRIVQMHGGRLEVQSEVGVGTTFRIHLAPAAVPG